MWDDDGAGGLRQRPEREPGWRRRRRAWTLLGVVLAALLALGSACTRDIDPTLESAPRIGTGDIELVRANDCAQLSDTLAEREQAVERMRRDAEARMRRDAEQFEDADSNLAQSATEGPAARSAVPPPATSVVPTAPAAPKSDPNSAGAADNQVGAADAAPGAVIAGTNLQEAGVDEGDMVKTDGRLLVALSPAGDLRVVQLGEQPQLTATVPVLDGRRTSNTGGSTPGDRGQVLLRGDEAVVVVPSASPTTGDPIVTIARVALDDPAGARVVERTAVLGGLVATRMVAPSGSTTGRIRIVIRPAAGAAGMPHEVYPVPPTTAPIDPVAPTTVPVVDEPSTNTPPTTTPMTTMTTPSTVPGTRPTESTSTTAAPGSTVPARDSDRSMTTEVRALLPRAIAADGSTTVIGGCSDVLVEPVPADTSDGDLTSVDSSGPTNVSVLTIGDSLADLAPVTVVGGADTVYASTDALYTGATVGGGSGAATAVHRFDLLADGPARYTGSGLVPGTVLDQYSMSERGGALRIVTTTTTSTPPTTAAPITLPPGVPDTVNDVMEPPDVMPVTRPAGRLTVLRPDDTGTLREVGRVDDIGVGEEVKSVRFLDDRAYVVTFRRTDPLFAIDLSNDTAPKVLGELKLPGFSEYLHPLGDGRMLGIGSDADPQTGRTTGFKATLFDVSDPTVPKELDSFVRAGVTSSIGSDPHAFTWDPSRHQAVVPAAETEPGGCPANAVCDFTPEAYQNLWTGAYVLGVDGDHLSLRGTLVHDDGTRTAPILRSVVVDSSIWTVSDRGVGRTDAGAPTSVALTAF